MAEFFVVWKCSGDCRNQPAVGDLLGGKMNSDELRELADALMEHAAHERQVAHDCDCRPEDTYNWRIHVDCVRAADFLRECAAAPQAEPKREPLSEEQMRAVLIAEARWIAAQAGEKDPDSLAVDEEMLAQVMLAGRAVERAHEIGGSDE